MQPAGSGSSGQCQRSELCDKPYGQRGFCNKQGGSQSGGSTHKRPKSGQRTPVRHKNLVKDVFRFDEDAEESEHDEAGGQEY